MSPRKECPEQIHLEALTLCNRLRDMEGVLMDDLDHSVHIAECEWESFFEESEGCCLLQPRLAGMENVSLSDAEEDSGSPDVTGGHRESQESTVAKADTLETNAAGVIPVEDSCIGSTMLSIQNDKSGIEKRRPDYLTAEEGSVTLKASQGSLREMALSFSGENAVLTQAVPEKTIKIPEATNCSMRTPKHECEPLICLESSMNTSINGTGNTEKALHEIEASFTSPTTEKERWFVTVNDNPPRKREHDKITVKKKRRKKKAAQNVCNNGQKLEINKAESKGNKDTEYLTQFYDNSTETLQTSRQREVVLESAQMHSISPPNSEKENVSQKLKVSPLHQAHLTHMDPNRDPTLCSEKPANLVNFTSSQMFPTKEDSASLDNTESEDFDDAVEMSSINSWDSESYLSATESTEKPIRLFRHIEEQPVDTTELQPVSTLTHRRGVLDEPASAQSAQLCEMQKVDFRSPSSNKACNPPLSLEECSPHDLVPQPEERCDQAYVVPTGAFAPAGPSDNMTEDSIPNVISMHRSLPDTPSDTPEALKHQATTGVRIPSSCGLLCTLPRPPSLVVPELTVTPLADSPEQYAQSLGHSRPVYAISAFWDEMEKLTINDILQLRMAQSPSPSIQEIGGPHGDVLYTQTHLGDTAESLNPDGASVETSDTADSDYFTHLDDSKPDRSSCEFSTFSDFDEECYQFAGASRNTSPDCRDGNQQSQPTTVSNPTIPDPQAEDTKPAETVAIEQCFEGHTLGGEHVYARGIARSKSMQNVQAFSAQLQLKDAPSPSELENVENRHQDVHSQEENTFWRAGDNVMLTPRTPAPILSNTDILDENYRITFPEVFEYLFSEDLANHESGCVAVYDSEGMPMAAAYDYTLSQHGAETPLSALQDSQCEEQKLIPIFSYTPSAGEDLTFPELDYLLFPPDPYEDAKGEEALSPSAAVSRADVKDEVSPPAAADDVPFGHKGWSRWKSWLSVRKIRFPGMCSTWCRRSGAWVFPVGSQSSPLQRSNQAIPMLSERKVASFSAQLFREVAAQQRLMTSLWTPVSLSKQEGLFSTLKQSDMCLVCIAVATWVLRSSDPRAADTWKAALLANVSALSAIQYLRHYVRKEPPGPEPEP